jgi:hypothetical protein
MPAASVLAAMAAMRADMPSRSFFHERAMGCWVDGLHLPEKRVSIDPPAPAPRALHSNQIGQPVDVHGERVG